MKGTVVQENEVSAGEGLAGLQGSDQLMAPGELRATNHRVCVSKRTSKRSQR